ncbi:MAG TPA: hypothetical protein PLW02_01815 [Verrucomicrobiota bacterium]|nr:hypothetical protein [Verrucomicrobiota bacterium]
MCEQCVACILADIFNTIGSRDAPATFYSGARMLPPPFLLGSRDDPATFFHSGARMLPPP